MISNTFVIATIGAFCLANLLLAAEAQSSSTVSYTILKLHTFKTETEQCKNYYAATRLKNRQNSTLNFGLPPNCTLCDQLNMQGHLTRIHKAIVKFAQPIADVYAFETSGSYSQLKTCVRSVQHVLLTLKVLMEIQIPAAVANQHQQTTTDELKIKTKSYLNGLEEYAGKQPTNQEVMSEMSVALMKELFVTAIVLQKDRIAIQKLASTSNQVI